MKKLILLFLLFPLFAHSQFCGYSYHAPISLSGASNQTISGDSILSITLTNCTNIHITKCKIYGNTTGIGITTFNCTNITIDSCYVGSSAQGVLLMNTHGNLIFSNNYVTNIFGSSTHTWHPFQIDSIAPGGSIRVQNNKFEVGGNPYVHDVISLFKVWGQLTDSAMVTGNWIRGGQTLKGSNGGAAAITPGDNGGRYIVVRGNYLINTGVEGIAADGHGTDMKIDHNYIYSSRTAISLVGLGYFVSSGGNPATSTNYIGNNIINWTDYNGNIDNKFNDPSATTPTGWTTNTANGVADTRANAGMIITPMITPCAPPVVAPVLSYSGSPYTFTAGTTIGALNIINTGGAVTSNYTVSPSLPTGLNLNTSTGQITGTPTTASSATNYVVSGSNSAGTGNATINITVNPAPIALPAFTYSPSTNIYTIPTTITPLMPISTGGAIVSFIISPSLPAGLLFNTTTGVISGTPTATSVLTAYTVTGFNSSGAGHTTVNIQVKPNPIVAPNISYSPSSIVSTYGNTLSPMTPTNTGSSATWSVSPALPPQCAINTSTGVITGVFTSVQSIQSYVVTATNNSGSSNTTIHFTVNKAPIGLYADNQVRLQNTANPTLTFTAKYYLIGDNASTAFTTQPVLSTTANMGSIPGTYPITISGATSNNYSITYHSGVMTVLVHPHKIKYRRVFFQH